VEFSPEKDYSDHVELI